MASINWRIWLAATLRPGAARDGLRPRLRPFPVDASLVFIMPPSNGLEAIRVINGRRNDSELFDEDQPMRTHFSREEARPLAESASVGKTTDTSRAAPKAPEDGARATPMMAQYVEIKAVNPDCLLFYRMGDFYELFFEDAEIASRALGIVLTKRGKHQGQDIPMCGVPVERADDYLQRLIAPGTGSRSASRPRTRPRPKSAALNRWCAATWCASSRPARSPKTAFSIPAAPTCWSPWRAGASETEWRYGLAAVDISTGAFPGRRNRRRGARRRDRPPRPARDRSARQNRMTTRRSSAVARGKAAITPVAVTGPTPVRPRGG